MVHVVASHLVFDGWASSVFNAELATAYKARSMGMAPDFKPAERAFYYARVIEIPTPRWTAYDAKRFGIKPLPGTAMVLQERAYTAPIWYTP